jgi:hypothetical protein
LTVTRNDRQRQIMRFQERLMPHVLAVIGVHVQQFHNGDIQQSAEHADEVLQAIGDDLRHVAEKLVDILDHNKEAEK